MNCDAVIDKEKSRGGVYVIAQSDEEFWWMLVVVLRLFLCGTLGATSFSA